MIVIALISTKINVYLTIFTAYTNRTKKTDIITMTTSLLHDYRFYSIFKHKRIKLFRIIMQWHRVRGTFPFKFMKYVAKKKVYWSPVNYYVYFIATTNEAIFRLMTFLFGRYQTGTLFINNLFEFCVHLWRLVHNIADNVLWIGLMKIWEENQF